MSIYKRGNIIAREAHVVTNGGTEASLGTGGCGRPGASDGEGPGHRDASRTPGWVANPGEALDSASLLRQ
jgi:hypothetical protein